MESDRRGWAGQRRFAGSFPVGHRLLSFCLVSSLLIRSGMCFGVGTGAQTDYYHQYVGSSDRMDRSVPVMPMENMMGEPQALRADRMMLRLIMDATTPSASLQRNNHWRSALNSQQNRNMWERLGWGW
ncbi:hypothetical protein M3Y97_01123000 [Aphelenchoides bicaudatus]|nr:hypothetical protein M3Y97_01123000 [Aphelenchoides bicaudatus]